MMGKDEFFDYIKDNVKNYLPPVYQGADVELISSVKNNDLSLTGIVIRNQGETVAPNIYLDSLYERYKDGGMSEEQALKEVVKIREELNEPELGFDVNLMTDYDSIKYMLQIRICDPEKNEERLKNAVATMHGDFAAVYYVNFGEIGAAAVTPQMFCNWGISMEQLHADAIAADKSRTPILNKLNDLIENLMFGNEPVNLLNVIALEDKKEPENMFGISEMEIPMYCLTNSEKENAAALILNKEVMAAVGDVLGNDFYVLPASVHEAMLVPATAEIELSLLQQMVKEINETDVLPGDVLSDKVQYYDRSIGALENAQERQGRMEKEKTAEKEPKSVLAMLAEKKEQSMAAGKDLVQKGKNIPQLTM